MQKHNVDDKQYMQETVAQTMIDLIGYRLMMKHCFENNTDELPDFDQIVDQSCKIYESIVLATK
jgi:hypothetical protein